MRTGWKAFSFGFPIGTLGGLIGLGGAEFRLPVLVSVFAYRAKRAVAINLAVSFVTVVSAFFTRITIVSAAHLIPIVSTISAMALASMLGAYLGSSYLHRANEHLLEKIIMALLIFISLLLTYEAFFPFASNRLAEGTFLNGLLAAAFGIIIGIVSALLGVAGGELIIPTLILVFGVPIKLAGTASLLISILTIAVGVVKYYRIGYYDDRADLTGLVLPMGIGSILGAITGGLMMGFISSEALKLLLGVILMVSAVKMFHANSRRHVASPHLTP